MPKLPMRSGAQPPNGGNAAAVILVAYLALVALFGQPSLHGVMGAFTGVTLGWLLEWLGRRR